MSISWESDSNSKKNTLWGGYHSDRRRRHHHYQPIEVFSSSKGGNYNISYALNEKIKTVCKDLLPSLQRLFLEFPTDEDKELVADYLLTCIHQENITLSTKKVYLLTLFYLSRHFNHKKSFTDMMMNDNSNNAITDYLASLHKDRALDPDQSWINAHNQRAMVILKFFKCSYNISVVYTIIFLHSWLNGYIFKNQILVLTENQSLCSSVDNNA